MKLKTASFYRSVIVLFTVCLLLGGCGDSGKATARKKVYRIVVLAPTTGSGASLGTFVRNGAELAREDLSAHKDVSFTIELLDNKNLPQEGVAVLRQALMKGKPDAVICAMSSVSKAIVPIVNKEGIFTVVTTTSLSELPQDGKTVVRVYPTSADYIAPSVNRMAKEHDKIAILYVQDDFGESNRKEATRIIAANGKKVVHSEAFSLLSTDVRETVQRVLSNKPEAIFVTGYGAAFIAIFKELKSVASETPVYSELGFANPAVLGPLGSAADGIVFCGTPLEQPNSTASDETIKEKRSNFVRRYRKAFKAEPYQVAGYAYDSILWTAELLANKGKVTKEDWVSRSPFEGVMGKIAFDHNGECSINLAPLQRIGGKTEEFGSSL